VPKIISDLEGNVTRLKLVTQALNLTGQSFMVNVYKFGEILTVEAMGMQSSDVFKLDVTEEDWSNSGYGSLRSLMGKMGDKESMIVELSRRVLENMFAEKASNGEVRRCGARSGAV